MKSLTSGFPSLLPPCYLLVSWQTNRNDKAQEFFAKQATELQNQAEWKDWFVLPFLPSPDTNPTFATYFSRQWADTFIVSLHNFLSVLFQCMHILSVAWGWGPSLRPLGLGVNSPLLSIQAFLLQKCPGTILMGHIRGPDKLWLFLSVSQGIMNLSSDTVLLKY